MTFEKDFPSVLLPKEYVPEGRSSMGEGTMTVQAVKLVIQQHCLDKQRVKDAVMFGGNACNCTFCGECCLRRDIIKELGL